MHRNCRAGPRRSVTKAPCVDGIRHDAHLQSCCDSSQEAGWYPWCARALAAAAALVAREVSCAWAPPKPALVHLVCISFTSSEVQECTRATANTAPPPPPQTPTKRGLHNGSSRASACAACCVLRCRQHAGCSRPSASACLRGARGLNARHGPRPARRKIRMGMRRSHHRRRRPTARHVTPAA